MKAALLSVLVCIALVGTWHCTPKVDPKGQEIVADAGNLGGECKSDQECSSWQKCKEGLCIQECTSDVECLDGYICSSNEGLCVKLDSEKAPGDGGDTDQLSGDCLDGDQRPCYSGAKDLQGKGICKSGKQVCQGGRWSSTCEGEVKPADEVCDGHDNDCDGEVDEGCKTCTSEKIDGLAPGHLAAIIKVAMQPGAKLFASISNDKTLKLWDPATGKLQKNISFGDTFASHMAFHPDGSKLYAIHSDATLKVWDLAQGKQLSSHELVERGAYAMFLGGKGSWLLTAGHDRVLRVRDLKSFAITQEIKVNTKNYNWYALSPDGDTLLAAQRYGNAVDLWSLKSGKLLRSLTVTRTSLYAVGFTPDGSQILLFSYSELSIYDAKTGQKSASRFYSRYTTAFSFHPDGTKLAVATSTGEVRVLAYPSGTQLQLFRGERQRLSTLQYSADGKTLVGGDQQGNLFIWDPEKGETLHSIPVVRLLATNAVAYQPKGKLFATVSQRTTLKLWDGESKALVRTFTTQAAILDLRFSPDGSHLAVGLYHSDNHMLKVWRVDDGSEVFGIDKEKGGTLTTLAYSPDGSKLLTANEAHTLDEWSAKDGSHLRTLRGHTGPVYSLAYAPSGQQFVSASWDNTVKLWDLSTGRPIHTLQAHDSEVNTLAYSPDGKLFATGSRRGKIVLWDASTRKIRFTLHKHTDTITGLSFHPNGKLLASTSKDGTMRLWEVDTGKSYLFIRGHASGVLSVAFSPDGKWLLSGDGSGTRLWDCPLP